MPPPQGLIFIDAPVIPIDHQLAQAEKLNSIEIVRDDSGDARSVAEIEQVRFKIVVVLRLDLLAIDGKPLRARVRRRVEGLDYDTQPFPRFHVFPYRLEILVREPDDLV